MGIVRTAFFLIGTTIGAGFLTGAELIHFFGGKGWFVSLAFSCVIYCVVCAFLLHLGKKYNGFSGTMRALFGRGANAVSILLLVVTFVPCAGMLAGLDELLLAYRPLPSIAGLMIVLVFLSRGMRGVSFLNILLVPLLLVFICFSGTGFVTVAMPSVSETGRGLLYATMNVAFAAPAFMDAGRDTRASVRSSVFACGAVFLCAAFILGGVFRAGADAVSAPMPYLYVMRGSKVFFAAVACAVLTSLASALFTLLSACERFAGEKKNAAKAVILLAAFLLSRLGLSEVIGVLYPAVGVFGALFSAVCIFDEYFFKQNNQRIHSRRQKAKDKGRAHHKVKFEHLATVDDQISESRS